MNAEFYIRSIQQITALRCPHSIQEKTTESGKIIRTPQPWQLLTYRDTETSIDIALRVPLGYSTNDLMQETDSIYAACGTPIKITDRAGVTVISIPKRDFPTLIPYTSNMLELTQNRSVLIGFDITGNPVTHNFRVPHMLVGAMPGYGKTDLIRWIIVQLISRFTPDQLHIDIVDGKGFSFLPFRGIPHIRRIVRDIAGAAMVMKSAKQIMNRRSSQIWDNNERNLKHGFKWHMVFVDELAVLSPSFQVTKEDKKVAMVAYANMASVACVGREASVGMVICTQRPDVNVVHPQVKQAMDVSIAFRTKTQTNSEIILDHAGAEKLPQNVPGRGIYSSSTDTIFQAPYIGDDDKWFELLQPYKVEWDFSKEEIETNGTETDDLNHVQ